MKSRTDQQLEHSKDIEEITFNQLTKLNTGSQE